MDALVGHNLRRHCVFQSHTEAAVVSLLPCHRQFTSFTTHGSAALPKTHESVTEVPLFCWSQAGDTIDDADQKALN